MGQGPVGGSNVATTPGAVVSGRYLVERLLGEGGMATVLQVKDLRTDRKLALKILKPEIAAHPEAVERFRREGEFLSSLKHPALIAVAAVGTLEDGRLYLAMELLLGETLGERIRRGRLSPTEISPILAGAAVGLDAAHRAGVVHRDLKPDNVFLSNATPGAAMQVKLLDFGISKIDGRASLTRTGQVLGTPRYMAPEQLRGEDDLDARVDVYALGVILYEALTGAPAFPAQQPSELILSILNGRIVPLRALRPDVGQELEGVVQRAMSKTREARYSSAIELAEAWFAVVHRDDGPKGVRVGVATNVLGSVGDSVRPRSNFSTEELRPATFRDFEIARSPEEPKPRALADLVANASIEAPDTTAPALAPSPRVRAAAVAFEVNDPNRTPPEVAPAAAPAPNVRSRTDSEPPRLPTTRRGPFVFGVLVFVGVVAAIAYAMSTTERSTVVAGIDAGIRFVAVPIVFFDAGAPRAIATPTDASIGVLPTRVSDTPVTSTTGETTTGVTTTGVTATTGSTSTPRDAAVVRPDHPEVDAGRHASHDSSPTTEPWTGNTDVTGTTTTAPQRTGSAILAEARAAASSGDPRRCIELASEAIAAGAEASVYRVRGDCYRALGDAPHALRSYQRFCTLAPNSGSIDAVRRAAQELGGSCP